MGQGMENMMESTVRPESQGGENETQKQLSCC